MSPCERRMPILRFSLLQAHVRCLTTSLLSQFFVVEVKKYIYACEAKRKVHICPKQNWALMQEAMQVKNVSQIFISWTASPLSKTGHYWRNPSDSPRSDTIQYIISKLFCIVLSMSIGGSEGKQKNCRTVHKSKAISSMSAGTPRAWITAKW